MKRFLILSTIAVFLLSCFLSGCDLLGKPDRVTIQETPPETTTAETTPANDAVTTPQMSKNDFFLALAKWDTYRPFSGNEWRGRTAEIMKNLDGEVVFEGSSLVEMDSTTIKLYEGIEDFTIYFAKEEDKYYEISKNHTTGNWQRKEFEFSNNSLAYGVSLAASAEGIRQELLTYEFTFENGLVTFKHPEHPEAYIRFTVENEMIVKWESYSLVEAEGETFHYTKIVDFVYEDVTVHLPSAS